MKVKFIKGMVTSHEEGFDLLLTPDDLKNVTKNGFLPLSIRFDKNGDPYGFRTNKRIAPIKTKNEIDDLARVSCEEITPANFRELSESIINRKKAKQTV